jgi:hypothetical protein
MDIVSDVPCASAAIAPHVTTPATRDMMWW